jgi:predicted RecB family nuclease
VTNVSGVGKTLAAELERIGITTIVDLAISEPDRLAQVKGISKKTAPALIKAAREALK